MSAVESIYVHFDDLDPMGLLHNTRYALLVERALSRFWDRHGYHFRDGRLAHPDAFVGVAEFAISYRAPIRGTGEVDVSLAVDRVGDTSVTYAFRVSSRNTLHAEGTRVHVRLDPDTLRPTTWGEDTRAIYKSLQA